MRHYQYLNMPLHGMSMVYQDGGEGVIVSINLEFSRLFWPPRAWTHDSCQPKYILYSCTILCLSYVALDFTLIVSLLIDRSSIRLKVVWGLYSELVLSYCMFCGWFILYRWLLYVGTQVTKTWMETDYNIKGRLSYLVLVIIVCCDRVYYILNK